MDELKKKKGDIPVTSLKTELTQVRSIEKHFQLCFFFCEWNFQLW
jgi:hypothetical protein